MPEPVWTSAQRRAIETVDRSVLVSAGAGSGKTAVLAERCAELVANPRAGCSVDQLLVVTFTDAASSEMRSRIASALRARLAQAPTNGWLQRQLALLDGAAISTLHSFCRQILCKYFAHAEMDPLMPLLDPADASLLQKETARQVFDEFGRREDDVGEAFLDFLAAYAPSGDTTMIDCALEVDAFLNSILDPADWLQRSLDSLATDQGALPDEWRLRFVEMIRRELDEQSRLVEQQQSALKKEPASVEDARTSLASYADALDGWRAKLQRSADLKTLDAVCRGGIGSYEFPPIPRKTPKVKALPEAELAAFTRAAEMLRTIRDDLFLTRLRDVVGQFTVAEWAEGIARTRPHAEIFVALVRSVRTAYQKAKSGLGVMDFGDLERRARDLVLNESNHVAARLRDRFVHVLVDECQDINPVQADILRLVSREAEAGRPANLFTVGDVKQSIYRFRLAEPMLFLKRRERFSAGGERGVAVNLVENFRSRPRVLDGINALMERLMATDLGGIDYDDSARLRPGPVRRDQPPDESTPVELHLLDDRPSTDDDESEEKSDGGGAEWLRIEREAYAIARRIQALVVKGANYGDIVILLRSMKGRAGLFVRTLSRLGIPVYADTSGGFFESLEVRDLLSLLALLDNEQQDIPLAAVLRSPLFGEPLSDSELVAIRTAARGGDADSCFHVAVAGYARSGADPKLRGRLAEIFDRMDRWRQRARRRPLADVVWEIYEESGYLAYVAGLRDGLQRRANLLQLHEYARQFGGFRRQGLYRFLRFIDGLRDAGEDLEPGAAAAPSGDVVRVMTIHRSKGLEFPIVILGELGKRFNLDDARGRILFDRQLGLALDAVDLQRRISYPTLPHRLVSRSIHAESLAEELRILYVALSRAKERIVLVGSKSLNSLAPLRDRLRAHAGPLPISDRLGARSTIDWVLSALACQSEDNVAYVSGDGAVEGRPLFSVHAYDAEFMHDWKLEPEPKPRQLESLDALAQLRPTEVPTVTDETRTLIQTVERRLTAPYPAKALTRVPAVAAATVLKRRWDSIDDPDERSVSWPSQGTTRRAASPWANLFRPPECLQPSVQSDSTNKGIWTHEFLQRLEIHRPCDAADLREQLRTITDAGFLTTEQSARIDLDSIAWFLQTPLAQRLRAGTTKVLREWPFVMGVDPSRYDPAARKIDGQDVLLVRGILDVLFDSGNGWEILDYKTDAIDPSAVAQRVEEYRGQLGIYSAAVQAVWQAGVKKRWLIFLSLRQIVQD